MFLIYMLTGKQILTISDSMLRGVKLGRNCDNVVRGGAMVKDLTKGVHGYEDFLPIKVDAYDIILIHVGTVDIRQGRSPLDIVMDVKELFDAIYSRNRGALVVVSAILYHPHDKDGSYKLINEANHGIFKLCDKTPNAVFLKTMSIFKTGKRILLEFYDVSGIHLNIHGKARLQAYFRRMLANETLRGMLRGANKRRPNFLWN